MASIAEEMSDQVEKLADPQHAEPATHTVLMRLREMVVTGKIAPGTRLRAEGLAAQLDVSRTPIRSALAVLSAEGLVSYSVNRGYTVRAVTIGDVLDSINVRATLEGLACRYAVEMGFEPEDLERLGTFVSLGRAIVDQGAWSEEIEYDWYHCNWMFHRSIHHASRNMVLRNAIRMTVIYPVFGDAARVCPCVARHVPPRLRQLPTTPPDHIVQSQAEHEGLLAAITAGDAAAAHDLMVAHVTATRERLHAVATLR